MSPPPPDSIIYSREYVAQTVVTLSAVQRGGGLTSVAMLRRRS
jgi:hypothetical protein